ncbi:aspartate ammonia-lyase [Sedimentisphaera salicampi]|uniref:Aspartate ammonia-lyase n=1 Tax=Sedimentisphaera salicampi TaxID=1941349 RepID=A0A1W6LJK2_9BACT|nr:aspartate ammonia-lyase [Sedimentisphaera salicampi]ARN55923.1 Aspartate ammonia-lyase [Sedimentisphaera salicampi]OXU16114.1 Aspartate ammonia-lyase [Sedimentisphaera salicampi]
MNYRTEKDSLGEKQIPVDSLSGIHTARAIENFGSIGGELNPRLLKAYGFVKLACAAVNHSLDYLNDEKFAAVEQASRELSEGLIELPPAPAALQGGAGTSTNMYVNEVIANRALNISGLSSGEYNKISPLDDINLHQSTNDTYPTAMKTAAIFASIELEQAVSELADVFQEGERKFSEILKLGRTQLQDAVPMTLGQSFGAWAEAFSKDRWRIYKCKERLRVINLGGTATGTGAGADRRFIFAAADELRKITGLPLARAENLVQATQNLDEIVEVSGILKALASNMFKIFSDLRLLSSGPEGGLGELILPQKQAGSSVMPGKVNPVIAEMACQAGIDAIAKDSAITTAAISGQLELNAFLPLIADNLLGMFDNLIIAAELGTSMLAAGIHADKQRCEKNIHSSTAVITAFLPMFGYEKCSQIAEKARKESKTIKQYLLERGLCDESTYEAMTSPETASSLGFRKPNR